MIAGGDMGSVACSSGSLKRVCLRRLLGAVLAGCAAAGPAAEPPGDPSTASPPTAVLVREAIVAKDAREAATRLEALKETPGVPQWEQRLLAAEVQALRGQWEEAREGFASVLADAERPGSARLRCLEGLRDCALAEGDLEAAESRTREALVLHPEVLAASGANGYFRNRDLLDTQPDYRLDAIRRLADAFAAAGNNERALGLRRTLALADPRHPQRRALCLDAAQSTLACGDVDGCFALLIGALDSGLDRCFATKARFGVNQKALDAVARPPNAEHLHSVLELVNRCAGSKADWRALDDVELTAFADAFAKDLARTYEPYANPAGPAFSGDGGETQAPWGWIWSLAAAREALRRGRWEQAEEILLRLAEPAPGGSPAAALPPGLAAEGLLLRVRVRMGLGRWEDAMRLLSESSAGPEHCVGDPEGAHLAQSVPWARLSHGVGLGEAFPGTEGGPIRPLPDDRTTRGDWFLGYGASHYALCAQNFNADRTGGDGPHPELRFNTADAKEPGRLWVSTTASSDPAALWDPARRAHVSANRDDHGEQVPLGEGPDLLVGCRVPEGDHVLSLYFVNDHTYYEPNRRYRISVLQDGGNGERLLARTEVADFGGGVYKRFAVHGPMELTVCIGRDVSMNVLLNGVFLDPLPVPWERLGPVLDGVLGPAPETDFEESLCRLRLLGRHRDASTAVTRRLAALPGDCPGRPAAEVLREELRRLVPTHTEACRIVRRLRLGKAGTHRWEQTWQAYLAALLPEAGTPPTAAVLRTLRTTVLSDEPCILPAARREAFERLCACSPEAGRDPVLLNHVGTALKTQGDREGARQFLELAREATAAGRLCSIPLFNLLVAQTRTEAAPAEVGRTWRELRACVEQDGRTALLHEGALTVARYHAEAKRPGDALEALAHAPEGDRRIEALRRQCRSQMEQGTEP